MSNTEVDTKAAMDRFLVLAAIPGRSGEQAAVPENIVELLRGAGVGLRLGANIGYIRFTPKRTWNPF